MEKQLTDAQIERARALRAEGKTYPEIVAEIEWEGRVDSVRAHCLDVAAPNMKERGEDRPEDGELVAFCEGRSGYENLQAIAERYSRPRHSLAARIKILQRRGRISPDWKPGPRVRRKKAG